MSLPGSASARCILPLPDAVVAQIKSSIAVVSLTGVVLELLRNALDAKATDVEATVDFARGDCCVEDNGTGIAPSEFRPDGSLCKIYCTSKYCSEDACLGRNGTFLASLSAMCLLHIVSRHHQNRSTNLLSFHHSKVIDRQLPAHKQHEIHKNHGTRVTVRNLFGNLPVRVKQRAALIEQKSEHHRLWDLLKREMTGLLLSWNRPVAVRVRGADGSTLLKFSNSVHTTGSIENRSWGFRCMLNTLTQAGYIAIDEWSSWVPVSASTSTVSIKGAISLGPAPTKRVQFISLGIGPLSAESGRNELYDEVNRAFSLSSFGTVEDGADVDDNEKIRRHNDKRFKSDGYTNRQLTARKGVDRYPMFHLRVSLTGGGARHQPEDKSLGDEANLQAVVGVLNAMIAQWLSAHHFRPRKPRMKRNRQITPCVAASDVGSASDSDASLHKSETTKPLGSRTTRSRTRESSEPRTRKRHKSKPAPKEQTAQVQPGPFAQWSRIKSGKADFFDTFNTATKSKEGSLRPSNGHVRSGNPYQIQVPPLLAGSPSINAENEPPSHEEVTRDDEGDDETMTWTDPTTKQNYLLNARTGCVLARSQSQPHTLSSATPQPYTPSQFHRPIRLPQRPATSTSGEASTPWLSDLLETWDNPVFKTTEQSIHQMCSHGHTFDSHGSRGSGSHVQAGKFSTMAAATSIGKLSKCGLASAEVMAQLDRKFILVKMRNSPDPSKVSDPTAGTEVLVLIDQHAADERIQVEALLSRLCKPLPKDHVHSGYRSKLGHRSPVAFTFLEKPIQFAVSAQEEKLFVTHAGKFSAWGILYNMNASSSLARQQSVLSVATLPPAISERCKADPQVLITCLRSTVWKYADAPHSKTPATTTETPESASDSWITRLSTCPQPLIDLINSRACRSAIMFNDELGLEECKELVGKLAECVFPFMCAHGRPSMVPIVDLGAMGREDAGGGGFTGFGTAEMGEGGRDFVGAWKRWKR